ncbi:MAG: MFS transporter, partial [Acidobacteriota bacterium]
MSRKAGRIEVLAWCLYDFADSSFTTLIVTVAYGLYFRTVVAAELGTGADLYWGICIASSMLIVAVLSPLLGAIADASGRKKTFLALCAATSIVFTGLLMAVERGDIAAGMLLFVVANIGYEAAHVFYNGFLPEIADEGELGRVSGYGWATGYLGGLAALLLTYPLTSSGMGPEAGSSYRLSFGVVSLFFLVFTLPILLLLRERAVPSPLIAGGRAREGFRRLLATLRELRRLRDLFRYLIAFIIYNDGVTTVIAFSAIYAMHVIGFSMSQVMSLFITTQLTALVGAVGAGHLVDRLGARPTITLTLLLWCGVVAGAFLVESVPGFYAVGIGASIGMGSTQTASRSLMGLLIPPGRSAEFFGLYALTGKVSAVLGPLLYGGVAALAGSERAAVLSLALFFVAGLLI